MEEIKKRALGSQGLEVPVMGLGCMSFAASDTQNIYGKSSEQDGIEVISRALELGCNFLDTADAYGPLNNERLIAKALKGRRNQVIIATKFGFDITDEGQITGKINGTKAYVKHAAERSLKNLGTDYIDLYYQHRLDPNTPIEETVEAMAELVKEGKVRYIGLSEVAESTLRRAHAIHPITAVQTEYSLFERTLDENGFTHALQELGIGLVAYSPLGRGFLSGQLKNPDDFEEEDARKTLPRFQGENFYKNLELVEELKTIATEKGVTTSQLALAWVMAKGHVPIPGTRRVKYAEENIAAVNIQISEEEIQHIESILPLGTSQAGDRYDEFMSTTIDKG